MKRKYIVIMIVLWTMAFVKFINNKDSVKEADIVTAFANNSFLSTESSVNAVSYLGNMYYSDEAKKDVLMSVASELGIRGINSFEIIEESGRRSIECCINSKYAITHLKFVTVVNEKDSMVSRQYVLASIDIYNSLESAVWYREKLHKAMSDKGFDSDITLTLKGNISGNLSQDRKDAITNEMIDSIGGKIVAYNKEGIYTVYAYSEFMDDYVVDDGKKININVAISYDEVLDETRIYMATPILGEDY